MKRAMLIAFHYPPATGSSGIQRTLSFSRYLKENGWDPIVLTAHGRAYPRQAPDQLDDIPKDILVSRAFALDSSRHLAIGGRYSRVLAYPDRWVSWFFGGVIAALRLVRKHRPSLIWSTYPIATAHLIGYAVHQITSLPWVADFRDSMTEDEYPADRRTRQIFRWIERKAVTNAVFSVFTAPGAVEMYAARYPDIDPSRWKCIRNGYDEQAFASCDIREKFGSTRETGTVVLLHSGILYPSERDPTAFFAAVRELLDLNDEYMRNVEIRFRASGFERELQSQIEAAGLGAVIKLMPPVSYAEALSEMIHADGLLIFQASNCNHQIPAKVYEYIRARRPILALTDPAGDTARLLREAGVSTIAELDSKESIVTGLREFLRLIATGSAPTAGDEAVMSFSRRSQAKELAELFDSVAE